MFHLHAIHTEKNYIRSSTPKRLLSPVIISILGTFLAIFLEMAFSRNQRVLRPCG